MDLPKRKLSAPPALTTELSDAPADQCYSEFVRMTKRHTANAGRDHQMVKQDVLNNKISSLWCTTLNFIASEALREQLKHNNSLILLILLQWTIQKMNSTAWISPPKCLKRIIWNPSSREAKLQTCNAPNCSSWYQRINSFYLDSKSLTLQTGNRKGLPSEMLQQQAIKRRGSSGVY